MREWGDEILDHKYKPLPEEAPRHRKKAKRRHERSDHKHEYEEVVVDCGTVRFGRDGHHKEFDMVMRCRVCGRIGDVRWGKYRDEPPAGMRMFRVDDWLALFDKTLPEDKEVLDG